MRRPGYIERRIGGKACKTENAIFERIKPIVLGFMRIGRESGPNPRTIGLIRSKVALSIFAVRLSVESFERMSKFETPLLGELS